MRRALLLVLFVMLVNVGAWWLLPSGEATKTVFYLQGTESMQAPVFSEQNSWRLSLESVTLAAEASRGLALFSNAKATFITLRLSAPSGAESTAPALSVSLWDDLGQEYGNMTLVECTAQTIADQYGWQYQLRFSPIDRKASSITILANITDASFHLTGLPLP